MLGFTFAMIAGPISTYYLTLNFVYKGNSSWAGATAAMVANLILVAYVVVAMREDQGDQVEAAKKEKKTM
ncbi:MAG: vacuolar ATPase assembly integral membrane protein vma21 [Trizodia sp. TS-e1964]|nr:MAG: vacuolar ATPase assembly integral membrane protein vma21 [Trizodia sp. TS-e1964]